MARGRIVSKSLSNSQRYARLHAIGGDLAEFCQALFPLLVAHADDLGREWGDAFNVKHEVCSTSPRTEDDIERALALLVAADLVTRYTTDDGRVVLQILRFDEHQAGLKLRKVSQFPDPPGTSRQIPANPGIAGEMSARPSDLTKKEEGEEVEAEGQADNRPALPGKSRRATLARSALALRGYAYPNDVVSVPTFCHARYLQRLENAGLDRPAAEAKLLDWYDQVCREWRGRPIGDKEPAFWDTRFEEWQGRTPNAAATKPDLADRTAAVIRERHRGRGAS